LLHKAEQFNQLLKQHHLFGDPASLRRELHGDGLIFRTDDCREYRRIERKPVPTPWL
jgi:hypothetical protein